MDTLIPHMTRPPFEDDHHILYFFAAGCLVGMLWFLSILP